MKSAKILFVIYLFLMAVMLGALTCRLFKRDPAKYRVTSDGTSYRLERYSVDEYISVAKDFPSAAKAREALELREWEDMTNELRTKQIKRAGKYWQDIEKLPPPVPCLSPPPNLNANNGILYFSTPTQLWTSRSLAIATPTPNPTP